MMMMMTTTNELSFINVARYMTDCAVAASSAEIPLPTNEYLYPVV